MYKIINKFLSSKKFDNLHPLLARKIFKVFKVFFVETNLKSLPSNNHPTNIDPNQSEIIKNFNNKFYRPFSTCSFLLELLSLYGSINKKVKILDFGANNLDNFIYLKRYVKNLEYFYHDLPEYNEFINELIKKKDLKNINIVKSLTEYNEQLDFTFFGSSIHYVNDYRRIIEHISKIGSKYLIFSHTPFFTSEHYDGDIVLKQVNIHPIINYAYLIEYNNFIRFMKDNNYELISQNKNNFIKFLNFKNFKNYSFISFLDLIFEKIEK